MPKPYPIEFRNDVVAVARKGEAPLNQIAKDFGISEACLHLGIASSFGPGCAFCFGPTRLGFSSDLSRMLDGGIGGLF